MTYDDMRDMQYREENPGREREIAYIPEFDGEERDPDIEAMVHGIYAHDNAKRREINHRAEVYALEDENNELRAILRAAGIEPPAKRSTD